MRLVNIRNVRGEDLRQSAQSGELVGVLKARRLVGVMIPISQKWVEHVIEDNWSRVLQSVTEGERAMASGAPLATLEDALGEDDAPPPERDRMTDRVLPRMLTSLGAIPTEDSDIPPIHSLRVGDLSAAAVETAGNNNELLAVTHAGELLGIMVPVTERLVGYLVNKSVSRVLYNISVGEKDAMVDEPMRTLEKAISEHSDLFPSGSATQERRR